MIIRTHNIALCETIEEGWQKWWLKHFNCNDEDKDSSLRKAVKHNGHSSSLSVLLQYFSKLTDLNKYMQVKVSKVGDHSRGRLEGPLFNSYYTKA